MIALAEAQARLEGYEEGRKEGAWLGGGGIAAVALFIWALSLVAGGTTTYEQELMQCKAGLTSPSPWNPLSAIFERDRAIVSASSSWISSVLTPEIAIELPDGGLHQQ